MPLSPENLSKALYEALPDPVLVIGSDRMVVGGNNAALAKFGYASEELAGM